MKPPTKKETQPEEDESIIPDADAEGDAPDEEKEELIEGTDSLQKRVISRKQRLLGKLKIRMSPNRIKKNSRSREMKNPFSLFLERVFKICLGAFYQLPKKLSISLILVVGNLQAKS